MPLNPAHHSNRAAGPRTVTGSRVRLRPLDRSHLASTLRWRNDPELSRLLGRINPVSEADHERWFTIVVSQPDCLFWAIEAMADGAHVGNVWLWAIDRRHQKAEVRIVIGEGGALNRGLGSEALDLVARDAFEAVGLHKLYAYVLDINPRALRAFEKAGFSREGLLRADRRSEDRFIDVHLVARVKADPA